MGNLKPWDMWNVDCATGCKSVSRGNCSFILWHHSPLNILGQTQSLSLDDMLILGEFLSGPRVVGTLPREGGDFPGCKMQLSSRRACLSVSVKSGGRTAARSQRATRGLRTTERPPLCRVRTAHVAGCTAPTLFHSPLQQHCRKPQSFILFFFLLPFLFFLLPPPFSCSPTLSEKSLHNAAGRLEWILQHPCGQRTCGQHSQDVCQLVH